MNDHPQRIIIGTRKSKLALWQSRHVQELLQRAYPGIIVELQEVVTKGDIQLDVSLPAIGGKGLFTAELEEELRAKKIDIAVHSLKDLPTEMDALYTLGAIVQRQVVRDVLITRNGCSFFTLPQGAVIGTSSPRRESQLLRLRPDLVMKDIRGNVDTRIRKVKEGLYDATLLAEAGLTRLGLMHEVSYAFTQEELLPAPGQGALAVQCLSSREDLLRALSVFHHLQTAAEVTAERAFLQTLQAGCSTPVAALATMRGGTITLKARVLGVPRCTYADGKIPCIELEDSLSGSPLELVGKELGRSLAEKALSQGARELLA